MKCSNLRGLNFGHDSGLVGNLLGLNLGLIHWTVKMENFYRYVVPQTTASVIVISQ